MRLKVNRKNAGPYWVRAAKPSDGDIQRAAEMVAQDLEFGSDIRGTRRTDPPWLPF